MKQLQALNSYCDVQKKKNKFCTASCLFPHSDHGDPGVLCIITVLGNIQILRKKQHEPDLIIDSLNA